MGSLARHLVLRLLQAYVTLLAASALVFAVTEVIPGDIAAQVLGREATPAERAQFRQQLNLDRPAYERYGIWLKNAVQGDLGTSFVSRAPVSHVIDQPLKNTLWLGCYAFVLYIPVVLLVGVIGAVFRDRPADRTTSVLTLVGLSLPEFVVGTLLVLALAITLPWFPSLAYAEPGADFFSHIRSLTLPALTLTIAAAVYAIRMLRDSLIDVLESDYVQMAELKGVPSHRILLRHALPNALGPALTVTAINVTYLISGIVVVELLFAYDGIGKLLLDSITLRDTPVVEAAALIGVAFYVGANLVADLVALLLNPRLRTA
jgi:peptide/nickel transport system permease protein